MKRFLGVLALAIAWPGMIVGTTAAGASTAAAQVAAPPCLVADDTCKESMAVGTYNFWYFRSYSLLTPNPDIRRAVIVMHGLNRDAPTYFATAVSALGNDRDPSLLVIAPHFKGFVRNSPTCSDALEADELHWSCTGQGSINRWDDGGQARDSGPDVIYSFDMIDSLLTILADTTVFPNLAKVTIAGHSDGGQFTQRYAAGNLMDSGLPLPGVRSTVGSAARPAVRSVAPRGAQPTVINVPIKYVIANPSSYMYLSPMRLVKGATCLEDGTCTANPPFVTDWDPTAECPAAYNTYKYGLDGRTYGYMDSSQPGFSDAEVASRFTARAVAYLMGEQDQLSNSQFDVSCAGNAQGSHLAGDGSGLLGGRRERGTIFWNYMRRQGASHTLTIVPTCGHDHICMLSSTQMIQAIMY
jgi:pimeloyl-ACP methyl ester carboxylesterase